MKRITLRIPDEVRDLLLAKSRDDHRSLSDTIRVIMTQYLGLKYRAKLDVKTNPELPLL